MDVLLLLQTAILLLSQVLTNPTATVEQKKLALMRSQEIVRLVIDFNQKKEEKPLPEFIDPLLDDIVHISPRWEFGANVIDHIDPETFKPSGNKDIFFSFGWFTKNRVDVTIANYTLSSLDGGGIKFTDIAPNRYEFSIKVYGENGKYAIQKGIIDATKNCVSGCLNH